jgi:hypothetical protein
MGKILSLEEMEEFTKGIPINDKNRVYAEEQISKGNMFVWYREEEKAMYIPYVKFTSQGFILAKRKQFYYEHGLFAGIRKRVQAIKGYKIL